MITAALAARFTFSEAEALKGLEKCTMVELQEGESLLRKTFNLKNQGLLRAWLEKYDIVPLGLKLTEASEWDTSFKPITVREIQETSQKRG